MTPAISVLVPTYNAARFLPRTLRSILMQTQADFELVIRDNGSTDASLDVARAYAAEDPRIRVERNDTNIGMVGNFTALLSEARGPLVKFVMADDLLFPTALEVLSQGLDDPAVSLATSRRLLIDDADERLPDARHTVALLEETAVIPGRVLADLVLEHQCNLVGEPTTVMFRRADVDPATAFEVAGHALYTAVDVGLWIRLLTGGDAFYSAEPQSCFRAHPAQTGRSNRHVPLEWSDWARLLLAAPASGLLADPAQEAQALTAYLSHVLAWLPVADPTSGLTEALGLTADVVTRLGALHREQGADEEAAIHHAALLTLDNEPAESAEPVRRAAVADLAGSPR